MNRREFLVGATAAGAVAILPEIAAAETTRMDAAMATWPARVSISWDRELVYRSDDPSEAFDLLRRYLTHCKETCPGFDYLIEQSPNTMDVYLKNPEEPHFHSIHVEWSQTELSMEEIMGVMESA